MGARQWFCSLVVRWLKAHLHETKANSRTSRACAWFITCLNEMINSIHVKPQNLQHVMLISFYQNVFVALCRLHYKSESHCVCCSCWKCCNTIGKIYPNVNQRLSSKLKATHKSRTYCLSFVLMYKYNYFIINTLYEKIITCIYVCKYSNHTLGFR